MRNVAVFLAVAAGISFARALDAAYDQAAYAPNMQEVIARFAANSDDVRSRIGLPKRYAYGPGENEGLGVYTPTSMRGHAPIDLARRLEQCCRKVGTAFCIARHDRFVQLIAC